MVSLAPAFDVPDALATELGLTASNGVCWDLEGPSAVYDCAPDPGYSGCVAVAVPLDADAAQAMAVVHEIGRTERFFPDYAWDPPDARAGLGTSYRTIHRRSQRTETFTFTAVDAHRMAAERTEGGGPVAALGYDHRILPAGDGALSVERIQWRLRPGPIGWVAAITGTARRIAVEQDCTAHARLAALLAGTPHSIAAAMGSQAPARSSDGTALAWLEPDGGDHRLRVALRVAEGWGAPATVPTDGPLFVNWADTPQVERGGDGALYATWPQISDPEQPYAYDVAVGRSTDDGAAWAALGSPHRDGTPTEHGFAAMATAPDGVRLFWLDGRQMVDGGPMSLRTAMAGTDLEPSAVLDTSVCDCCGVAAGVAAGEPFVVYRDRTELEVRDPAIARHSDVGWSTPTPVHPDRWVKPGCPVNGPRALATAGRLAVAWYTEAAGPEVRLALSMDGGANFGPAHIVASGPVLGRVDLAPHGAGLVVSWLEGAGEAASLMARRVDWDGRGGTPLRLIRTHPTRKSGFPRVAFVEGRLDVVWTAIEGETTELRGRSWSAELLPLPTTSLPRAEAAIKARAYRVRRPKGYAPSGPDGVPMDFDALAGRPLLVNLWATWCGPCRSELPQLAAVHRDLGPRGLAVVGIAVDDDPRAIRRLADAEQIPYALALDGTEAVTERFGSHAVPTTLLFDAAGALAWSHSGALEDTRALRAAVEELLSNP